MFEFLKKTHAIVIAMKSTLRRTVPFVEFAERSKKGRIVSRTEMKYRA